MLNMCVFYIWKKLLDNKMTKHKSKKNIISLLARIFFIGLAAENGNSIVSCILHIYSVLRPPLTRRGKVKLVFM